MEQTRLQQVLQKSLFMQGGKKKSNSETCLQNCGTAQGRGLVLPLLLFACLAAFAAITATTPGSSG